MQLSKIFSCTHPMNSQEQIIGRENVALQICTLCGSYRWLGTNLPNIGGWNRPTFFDELLQQALSDRRLEREA